MAALSLLLARVWASYTRFTFLLENKDAVQRLTMEDFVRSVVSHRKVSYQSFSLAQQQPIFEDFVLSAVSHRNI